MTLKYSDWIVTIHPIDGVFSPLQYHFDGSLSKTDMYVKLDSLVPSDIDYRVEIVQYGGLRLHLV